MQKKKNNGSFLLVGILLVGGFCLFIFKFSMVHFQFHNARVALETHIRQDFDISLPSSTEVKNAYWVGSRDPEEVFGLQMAPGDVAPFMDQIHKAGTKRKFQFNELSEAERAEYLSEKIPIREFKPLYGVPPWWNNPLAGDERSFSLITDPDQDMHKEYGVSYSVSTGRVYLYWGTN